MKTKLTFIVLSIVLVAVVGCAKKDPPQSVGKTEQTQAETDTPGTVETLKETAVQVVKESFSMDIDLEKTVANLKTEATQMDVESLKEVATKYKKVIAEKEANLQTLLNKLSAVPLTEKMGKEAQGVTAEIKTLTNSIGVLQERFQVYIDALTEKGVDVRALLG